MTIWAYRHKISNWIYRILALRCRHFHHMMNMHKAFPYLAILFEKPNITYPTLRPVMRKTQFSRPSVSFVFVYIYARNGTLIKQRFKLTNLVRKQILG